MKTNFKALYRSFILLLIILVILTAAVCGCKDRNTTQQNINAKAENTENTAYTVREYDGRIAVFSEKSENPDYVLESPLVRDLPFSDRKALNEGITASGDEELRQVLEDYDN